MMKQKMKCLQTAKILILLTISVSLGSCSDWGKFKYSEHEPYLELFGYDVDSNVVLLRLSNLPSPRDTINYLPGRRLSWKRS
jgi:hypothetical protein